MEAGEEVAMEATLVAALPTPTPRHPLPGVSEALTQQARDAATVAISDWGPVFVYGMMLSGEAWSALIGRVPEMIPAKLEGYERHGVQCSAFAAIWPEEGGFTIGQMVVGLRPWERRLLDAVVDDGFTLTDTKIKLLDDPNGPPIDCTVYAWRKEFEDALKVEDWDMEVFQETYLKDFADLCRDMRETHRASKLDEHELKELALARRRREPDDEDDASYKSEPDEDDST
mmetsp:Transcript_57674/g.160762  ORF Transcript_57674/g.160762 Transcript_57674/m.160762 type:complete len:229 (-) Transcript_57674:42-728(-)